jgi:cytochrome c-type biogenesis protein CcmE
MSILHKRRCLLVVIFLIGITAVVSLVLYALQQNINLFYTPVELLHANFPAGVRVRVGGMVQPKSLQHSEGLQVNFIITDYKAELAVKYNGLLPDLFREGQGVVALGVLQTEAATPIFIADQILAKHDENYMPPELTNKLSRVQDDT